MRHRRRLRGAAARAGDDVWVTGGLGAAKAGLDALAMALHGGEDFELCLMVPAGTAEALGQGFHLGLES